MEYEGDYVGSRSYGRSDSPRSRFSYVEDEGEDDEH
jgi:hypothetical protein